MVVQYYAVGVCDAPLEALPPPLVAIPLLNGFARYCFLSTFTAVWSSSTIARSVDVDIGFFILTASGEYLAKCSIRFLVRLFYSGAQISAQEP